METCRQLAVFFRLHLQVSFSGRRSTGFGLWRHEKICLSPVPACDACQIRQPFGVSKGGCWGGLQKICKRSKGWDEWLTFQVGGDEWRRTLWNWRKDSILIYVLFVCLFVIHLFFWLGFVFEMGHHMYNIRSVIKFDMISIYTFSSPFWNPDPFCSQFWLAPEKKHQTEVFFSWVFHWQFHVHFLFLRCDFLLAAGWLVSLWTGSLYASNNDGKVFLQLLSLAKTGGNGISQSKDNRSWPSKLPLVKTAPTVNIGDN